MMASSVWPLVEDVVEHQHRAPAQVLGRTYAPVEQGALDGVAVARGVQVGDFEREGAGAAGCGWRGSARRSSPHRRAGWRRRGGR